MLLIPSWYPFLTFGSLSTADHSPRHSREESDSHRTQYTALSASANRDAASSCVNGGVRGGS